MCINPDEILEKLRRRVTRARVPDVARKAGVAESTVRDIVSGRSLNPGIYTIAKIMAALKPPPRSGK